MGIKLLESLEMQTGLPLDSRDIVANIDQRNNIEPSVRYIGMEVYVSEENKKYRLEDGIENFNWKEMKAIANASELITDDDHLTVSKIEKETWSGKAERVHTHTANEITNFTHTHKKSEITDFSHTHLKSEITDFPESLKNPSALTVKLNGTPTAVYDGSAVKEVNITPASIGAQPSGDYALATHNHDGVYQPKGSYADAVHTHTASQVSGLPTSLKNPTALTISLNGTSQGAYDGSTAKSINITSSSIGAQPAGSYAASNHNHSGVYQPVGSYAVQSNTYTKSEVDKLVKGVDLTNYFTKAEIEQKFKNFCPIRVGDILLTTLTTNPATDFLGTTWQELPQNKFLKTGSTPLQQAGTNSIKIAKANLPTDKLQITSLSMTRGTMEITGKVSGFGATAGGYFSGASGAFYVDSQHRAATVTDAYFNGGSYSAYLSASRSWTGSTSSASPYTTAMGSGTAISINPEHITVRAWKRLT